MKYLLQLIFIFTTITTSGQANYPAKKDIQAAINMTISQKFSKANQSCEMGKCGEWFANNKDSSFYKSDTIRFYNSSNSMYDTNHYCFYKIWDFGKANKFSQSGIEICHEPPLTTMEISYSISTTGKRTWKIPINAENFSIIENNNAAFIITYTGKKVFEKYKVISLNTFNTADWGDNSFELILVRQKSK